MVSGITEEDVHSMFEMRLLVEPYALRTYGADIPREELEPVSYTHLDVYKRQAYRLVSAGIIVNVVPL